jgi:hypothetical protein
MRAVWKVRGLTSLLRVRTLWRCGDGLFFEVPPLACTSYSAPPTSRKRVADRWSLRNFLPRSSFFIVGRAHKSHGVGRDLDFRADVIRAFHRSTFSYPDTESTSDLAPCDFWAFPTMKMELRGKKFQSDQRSAVRFREVGGVLQEMHRLPREVHRERDRHRTSTKFRLGVIRWVHELFLERPSYMYVPFQC